MSRAKPNRLPWVLVTAVLSGLAMFLAASISSGVEAHDTGKRSQILHGLNTSARYIYHDGWHYSEANYSALDLNLPNDEDAGMGVVIDTASTNLLWARAYSHYSPANCTGVDVQLYDYYSGEYLGAEHYVHIDPASGIPGSSWAIYTGRVLKYLGNVSTSQPSPCDPDYWTGSHLHQSGHNELWTHLYTNVGIPQPIDTWSSTQWMHELRW